MTIITIIIWDEYINNRVITFESLYLPNGRGYRLSFSTLHTTPLLYGKLHFGVLHLLRASIAAFDIPPGLNPI